MSDITFERFLTIISCIIVIFLIYCYWSIKNSLNQLDNLETEEELLEIKQIISNSSFYMFLFSTIPIAIELIFGFG